MSIVFPNSAIDCDLKDVSLHANLSDCHFEYKWENVFVFQYFQNDKMRQVNNLTVEAFDTLSIKKKKKTEDIWSQLSWPDLTST